METNNKGSVVGELAYYTFVAGLLVGSYMGYINHKNKRVDVPLCRLTSEGEITENLYQRNIRLNANPK